MPQKRPIPNHDPETSFVADMAPPTRTPPTDVRRALRLEVAFGCPVPGCGNPYLMWHHFDPPWSQRQHHDVAGMIALCAEHHAKADAGAFTKEQLREFKTAGASRSAPITGRFDWMRRDVLAVVGGSFFYETPIIIRHKGQPLIWFNRDASQMMLLNLRMLSGSGQPRLRLDDNFWLDLGQPTDFECQPNGRLIHGYYPNGDELRVEYFDVDSLAAVRNRWKHARTERWDVKLPITAIEVWFKVGGTEISFGPTHAVGPGYNIVQIGFASHCNVGIDLT